MRGLLTPTELAHELGCERHKVYRLLKDRKIPGTKLGGDWLIPRRWLEQLEAGDNESPHTEPAALRTLKGGKE